MPNGMKTPRHSRIVRDAQKIYALWCRHIGCAPDLGDPGELHRLYEFAGDDDDTVRRAIELCKEDGVSFTGRSNPKEECAPDLYFGDVEDEGDDSDEGEAYADWN